MIGAELAAASSTLVTNILLIVVAVPASIVAFNSIEDRRARKHQEGQHAEIERIGTALFGPDRSKWPGPRPDQGEPVGSQIDRIADQLTPSNGKTVAAQIQETNHEMGRIAVLLGEHMSDGHGGQVWPAGR